MKNRVYRATRRTNEGVETVFMWSSLPDPNDAVIDGNQLEGELDANDQT